MSEAGMVIRRMAPVGRYALRVDWSDGHESIVALAGLRLRCTCRACQAGGIPPPATTELDRAEALGDASLYLRWRDGHESFFFQPELRGLCRCAYCVAEPERPITG